MNDTATTYDTSFSHYHATRACDRGVYHLTKRQQILAASTPWQRQRRCIPIRDQMLAKSCPPGVAGACVAGAGVAGAVVHPRQMMQLRAGGRRERKPLRHNIRYSFLIRNTNQGRVIVGSIT